MQDSSHVELYHTQSLNWGINSKLGVQTCAEAILDADVLHEMHGGASAASLDNTATSYAEAPPVVNFPAPKLAWHGSYRRLHMPQHLALVHVQRSREHRAEPSHLQPPGLDCNVQETLGRLPKD